MVGGLREGKRLGSSVYGGFIVFVCAVNVLRERRSVRESCVFTVCGL